MRIATGIIIASTFAMLVSALYIWTNAMFAESSGLALSLALLPVGFFLFASYRNGVQFTLIWSLLMFGLTFLCFFLYGMDAGWLSFVLVGFVSTLFIAAVCVVALAYRPQDGAMGALWRRGSEAAGSALQRTKGGGGLPPTGINLMTALLVANLVVSLMGMLV